MEGGIVVRYAMTIEMEDGTTFDVDADARDIRAWEAEHDQSWLSVRTSATTIAQLGYLAGRRTGALNGQWPDYETFDAACVWVAMRRDEPLVADPTPPDRTAASSARSRSGSTSRQRSSKPKGPQ